MQNVSAACRLSSSKRLRRAGVAATPLTHPYSSEPYDSEAAPAKLAIQGKILLPRHERRAGGGGWLRVPERLPRQGVRTLSAKTEVVAGCRSARPMSPAPHQHLEAYRAARCGSITRRSSRRSDGASCKAPNDTSPAAQRAMLLNNQPRGEACSKAGATVSSQRWIKQGRGGQPLGEGVQQLAGEPQRGGQGERAPYHRRRGVLSHA